MLSFFSSRRNWDTPNPSPSNDSMEVGELPPPPSPQECWKKPRKVCQTLVTLKPKIVTEKVPKEVCEDYSLKVSIFEFSSSKICGGNEFSLQFFVDLSLLIIFYGLQLISITKTYLVFRVVRVSGTKAQGFNLFLIIRPKYEVFKNINIRGMGFP